MWDRTDANETIDNNCVAVARHPDGFVCLADTKQNLADQTPLFFTPIEWSAFEHAIREGRIDRWPKRPLMIAADLLRAVAVALLAVLVATGAATIPTVALCAAAMVTDIDLELLSQAQEILGTTTKKATVNGALREMVRRLWLWRRRRSGTEPFCCIAMVGSTS